MAKEVGYYSPSLAKRIKDNSLAWERERQGLQPEIRPVAQDSIFVVNSSTHTIPKFGCMQVVGAHSIEGQVFLKVDRPFDYSDSVMGPFLFNGIESIQPGKIGLAQNGPVYRAIKDTGTFTIGTRLNPTADSFKLSKGPLFVYLGDDDIDTDIIKVERCETPLLAVAGSGIAANSSGTVTAKQPASGNWTAGSVTYTAWAPTAQAITAGATCLIWPVDAKWVAVEIC